MQRRALASPGAIIVILILQVVPLLLFPASSFSAQTQEWWLPLLLAIMVVIAAIQVIVRRSVALWPWLLMGFAQGFNIISRLMMVWAHSTKIIGDATVPNWSYLGLTLAAVLISTFLVQYFEKSEIRNGLLRY